MKEPGPIDTATPPDLAALVAFMGARVRWLCVPQLQQVADDMRNGTFSPADDVPLSFGDESVAILGETLDAFTASAGRAPTVDEAQALGNVLTLVFRAVIEAFPAMLRDMTLEASDEGPDIMMLCLTFDDGTTRRRVLHRDARQPGDAHTLN